MIGNRTEDELKADIEHVNKCLNPLCLYSTADLVNELASRDGVRTVSTIENSSYEAYITNENDEIIDCAHGFYPDTILVIRGDE